MPGPGEAVAALGRDDRVPYCGILIFFSLVVWALELYIDLRQVPVSRVLRRPLALRRGWCGEWMRMWPLQRRRLGQKRLPTELEKDFTVVSVLWRHAPGRAASATCVRWAMPVRAPCEVLRCSCRKQWLSCAVLETMVCTAARV